MAKMVNGFGEDIAVNKGAEVFQGLNDPVVVLEDK